MLSDGGASRIRSRTATTRRALAALRSLLSERFELAQVLVVARSISMPLHGDQVVVATDPEFSSVCKFDPQRTPALTSETSSAR